MGKLTKKVISGIKARDKFLKGVNIVGDAVSSTLGPRGNNVAINMPLGAPLVIHDGVTVSRSIDLEDPFEDMGAQLIKEAAEKTVAKVGDGTTLTTILAQTLLNEGYKLILDGVNPMKLKAELEDSLRKILEKLSKLSKPVKTAIEIEQVATISSASPELGKLISEVMEKVGKEGVITVNGGSGFETKVHYTQGMEIAKGYLSTYFVTDSGRSEAILKNPYILITDKKLNYAYDVAPIMEKVMEEKRPLLIIASEVIDEALSSLVLNKLRGIVEVCAINAPAWGGFRIDELQDIAVVTSGHVISDESGREMNTVVLEDLGQAEKVIVSRDKTIIQGGQGTKEALKARMDEIREQIKTVENDFERTIREKRLAGLSNGVAVIEVGAISDIEMKDRKERIIDAVAATRAAVEEGIVAGGEVTLLKLSEEVDTIAKQALTAPFNKLLKNAGTEVLVMPAYPNGVDVMDNRIKDMFKAGIIDPTKVLRVSLENAFSVALMGLTTETLVSEKYDNEL